MLTELDCYLVVEIAQKRLDIWILVPIIIMLFLFCFWREMQIKGVHVPISFTTQRNTLFKLTTVELSGDICTNYLW